VVDSESYKGKGGSVSENWQTLHRAGEVQRYHTQRVIYRQSIADHSWGVAMVLMALYHPVRPPAELLLAALLHDLPEHESGDVPATAKWENDDLDEALYQFEINFWLRWPKLDIKTTRGLIHEHKVLLSWADRVDLLLYCFTEIEMGNRRMLVPAGRIIPKLRSFALMPANATRMLEQLEARLKELT
jgi:5'-deoxynucleotidase YfbR-like HD superfamily hydrolase